MTAVVLLVDCKCAKMELLSFEKEFELRSTGRNRKTFGVQR